jgi:hypothetical protein
MQLWCLLECSWQYGFFVFRICRCLNATIQHLLTGTNHYQNGIISYLPESQDNCGSGGMLFTATRAEMAPLHRYRQTSTNGSIWTRSGTTYGRICLIAYPLYIGRGHRLI